ncbi:MAG: hypothetical protein JSW55_00995 [Chloroflexota bacterium]|nr:MAG: hypothetical protein JSW55_00995 [Chloroflexota bacterium]
MLGPDALTIQVQTEVEENLVEDQEKRNVPAWAWVLGCLGLLAACAVVVGLGAALAAIFVVTSASEEAGLPTDFLAEATVVAESTDLDVPELTIAPTTPAPDTAEPEPTPVPSEAAPESAESAAVEGQAAQAEADDPFAAARADIETRVASIRRLEPKEPVEPVSLTRNELRQRVEGEFLADYGPQEARRDAIALSAFDFMPADFELHTLILELLTEQVLGYYDTVSDEFVIISDDDQFDTLEQLTHAHEYVHALQDQHYNLDILDDETLDSEALFAAQAMVEGEATFVQNLFMLGGYFELGQLLELVGDVLTVDMAVLESAPPVLAHELEFPYLSGVEFVQALYEQGGFQAIDAAWNNMPQSTEQILHPQRYLDGDAPQLVTLAPLTDTLGAGWSLVEEDVLGEFYLREYLAQQLENDLVDQAATGWGGDRYAVYWHEASQAPVLVLKLAWDTPADADEFADIYPMYAGQMFGVEPSPQDSGMCWSGEDIICFYSAGGESLVVRTPDMPTAAKVAVAQNIGG